MIFEILHIYVWNIDYKSCDQKKCTCSFWCSNTFSGSLQLLSKTRQFERGTCFFRRNCCCFCERANTHLFKTPKIIKNDWKLLMLRSFEVEVFCVLQIAIILSVNALHIAAYVYMWCCTCMYYVVGSIEISVDKENLRILHDKKIQVEPERNTCT